MTKIVNMRPVLLFFFFITPLSFSCIAQTKEYPELIASGKPITDVMIRVFKDTKSIPKDDMIYFINITKNNEGHDIAVTLAAKNTIPYLLVGRKYKIAGYSVLNETSTIIFGKDYYSFFRKSGKKQIVWIKDSYPLMDEGVIPPNFESFRWVFHYKNNAVEFIRSDNELPFE